MKKILIISLFVLGLIIPNINVKAVDVSNEEELRNAIANGGDITLTNNIEITKTLEVTKDVNISGENYNTYSIMMQGDNTLMTINGGNVTLDVDLYAGWNGEYHTDMWENTYPDNVVNGQGTALVVNGGNVNFDDKSDNKIYAGNVGIEVNGGTVTGTLGINAGEYNYDENTNIETFAGGTGLIVNDGTVKLNKWTHISAGDTGVSIGKKGNVTFANNTDIYSWNNGLELDGGTISGSTLIVAGFNGDINGPRDDNGSLIGVTKDKGIALIISSGNCSLSGYVYAGKEGIEVNGGTVTSIPGISAGVKNDNGTYSDGRGLVINGGNVSSDRSYIESGSTALTVNNGTKLTLTTENGSSYIQSYEGNGIEVNDGSVVNINSRRPDSTIFGSKNAIYLNGGSINLNGSIGLSSSTEGKGIYINKGVNTVTGGDILNLGKDFVFSYEEGTTPNFSIYVNPDIQELKVTDEKNFMELLDNKLNLGFCSSSDVIPNSQTEEERKATCSALGRYVNYDGAIESNELGKCTVVYINGEKQNEVDASCNPVVDKEENNNQGPQVVEVPSTSAYGSVIIAVLGIVCVIVSVFVMRKMTNKA